MVRGDHRFKRLGGLSGLEWKIGREGSGDLLDWDSNLGIGCGLGDFIDIGNFNFMMEGRFRGLVRGVYNSLKDFGL